MPAAIHNLLIAGLPASSRNALLSGSESVELLAGDRLCETGGRVAYAYFPVDCSISLAMRAEAEHFLAVGVVGFEGMTGLGLILDSPVVEFRAQVQASGRAWRVESAHFRRQLAGQPEMRARMNRYAYVRLLQLAQDVTCRSLHLLEGRLARQLLMARDRARSNYLALTHATLARWLGVRRAGVTLNASELQKRGLMRYARGDIQVLEPAGLRATACSCYAADRKTYARLMGRGGVPE